MSSKFKQAIIIGASSGIGAELARQLAGQGCMVALVARRESELKKLAQEIGEKSKIYPHDVTSYEQVPSLFQQITRDLGGVDLIIYSAGVMPAIAEDEYTFDKDATIFEVNVLGAIAWLNEAAKRFTQAKSGTIVGISSVAGDRGRRGQPAYCASKAALSTYLEALRNRIGRYGVNVLTVKPGPVDTPMTHGLSKLPMLISAPAAASQILHAANMGGSQVYVPGQWRYIMGVIRHIPSFIFKKMNF